MDLVDEQHVALLEIGEQRGEIAGLGDDRAGRRAEIDAELARHDLRQRGLAEPGRADEQHVVERLVARARRLDEHLEIGARLLWPMNSSSRCGRSDASATSSSRRSACHQARGCVLTVRPRRVFVRQQFADGDHRRRTSVPAR